MKLMRVPFLLGLCLLLPACASRIEEAASDDFAPVQPVVVVAAPQPATGGIYRAGNSALFAHDRRAAQVGDILTVEFSEEFRARKSQSASGSRTSDYGIDLPDILPLGVEDQLLAGGADQSYRGDGDAAQSNSFSGRLSVSVSRVLPNGNLEIIGQKRLTLNNGQEYVRLSGVVRPEDIGPDNVVLSERVAHADIRYVGAGDTADTAKAGWLYRIMTTASPL